VPIRDELVARTVEALRRALEALAVAEGSARVGEIRRELDGLFRAHVGSGPELARRLGGEDLLDVLRATGGVDAERAYLLGALLEVDAAALEAEDPGAGPATDVRARALDLVLEAALARVGEDDVADRVDRLARAVPPDARGAATWSRLHRLALQQGAYARAEDELFAWLEAAPSDDVVRAGYAFYGALAGRDDAELAAGDLPRDEVLEGAQAFASKVRVSRRP